MTGGEEALLVAAQEQTASIEAANYKKIAAAKEATAAGDAAGVASQQQVRDSRHYSA